MIPFPFDYYRPKSMNEALEVYAELVEKEKKPIYYSGGTEILTLSRLELLTFNAVIDLKSIPDCHVYGWQNDQLIIGSCLTLNQLNHPNHFPLLGETASKVADHTSRNKITIGGHICGEIIYKEALLPLLLTDSTVIVAGIKGQRSIPISDVLSRERLLLNPDEFIVQIIVSSDYLNAPFFTVKKRRLDEIGYPLLTLASLKVQDKVRVAFSGLLPFPFRSQEIESLLNNHAYSKEDRIEEVLEHLPGPVLNDWQGSDRYRKFVLKNTLFEMFEAYDGEGTF